MTEPISFSVKIERMRAALMTKAQSYRDLQALSGLHMTTVRRWVAEMRALEPKRISLAPWALDERGRPMVTMLRWGDTPDAPRPGKSPEAHAERQRRLRKRKAAAKGVKPRKRTAKKKGGVA